MRRSSRPFLVGLTGGLASGKSTVGQLLAERGCRVIDADDVVAWLYESGRPGALAVEELFGHEFLDTAGSVDRGRLAGLVFSDPAALHRLEAAIHPLVRRRFEELAAEELLADGGPGGAEAAAGGGVGIVVLEATLLVEAGFSDAFDLVVAVEAPVDVRRARAISRGLSESAADARLAAQGDGAARRAGADRTIDNAGDLADLERSVERLLVDLRRLAAERAAD
ncbi:MAG TPA: dephospho-CoA kinase [Thermoanaerobaculia bacterium]|nr:dephospho-CoA kinase [Thermoanaerobaculia bacterium]